MRIVIKGSPYVRGEVGKDQNWKYRKDMLHRERKEIESDLKQSIFTKDQMNQLDCQSEQEEQARVNDYIIWKELKDNSNLTNEQKMNRWHEINKEFKEHKEEGKSYDTDMLRRQKSVKYD